MAKKYMAIFFIVDIYLSFIYKSACFSNEKESRYIGDIDLIFLFIVGLLRLLHF